MYVASQLQLQKIKDLDLYDLLHTEKIGIEDARNIKSFLLKKPIASPFNAVILEGDLLTIPTQHALLKTLEEPPEKSLLYIGVSRPEILLDTVLSRCLIITLDKTIPTNDSIIDVSVISFWNALLQQTPVERMLMTTSVVAGKQTNEAWIKSQIIFFRHVLLSLYTSKPHLALTIPEVLRFIRQLTYTYLQLKNNVSPKLLVDHLFLNFPVVKKSD